MKTIRTFILLTGLSVSFTIRLVAQPDGAPPPPETIEADTIPATTTIDTVSEPPPEAAAQPSKETLAPTSATAEGKSTDSALTTNQSAVATTTISGDSKEIKTPVGKTSTPDTPSIPAKGLEQVTNEPLPLIEETNGNSGLRLNFRGVPLEMVLNYLSDAAGFIIVMDTQVKGKVDVWSGQPLDKDEAVNLLNTVLNKNGYAAIRNGRTLTIVNKDEAKTKDIPVVSGGDPDKIPRTDEMVTQIIPVRFVEAAQLIKDLQPLVSVQTTMTANEAGNSVIITDTRANIHRIAEVIKAIDTSAEDETEVRVFRLKYHDPTEVATLLTSLFADQSSSSGSQTPIRLGGRGNQQGGGGFGGGPGGFMARMMAASTASSSSPQSDRIKKRQRVVAVADERMSSVVVTTSKDLMDQIAAMIDQLDHESPKVAKVSVIHLENADPQQVQQVLQDMFQTSTTSRNRSSSTQSPLQTRIQQNNQSSGTSSSSSSRTTSFGSSTRSSFGQ